MGTTSTPPRADEPAGRWTQEQATSWCAARRWECGANYLPSTAVNWTAMWQAVSHDPITIEREVGWAADVGLTSLRVGLPFVVWEHDRDGLLERFDAFLGQLDRHAMTAVPFLLDDCEFSGAPPSIGAPPPPVPGLHNSRATGSPGRRMVVDRTKWPNVLRYVADVVAAFADDRRVLLWDLYNEPGNRVLFTPDGALESDVALEPAAMGLLHRVFATAREVAPAQPLTTAAWRVPPPDADTADRPYDHPLDEAAFSLSDLTSIHAYCPPEAMEIALDRAAAHERPVLCTEWMGRHAGSRIVDLLPLLRRRGVWCWTWGFVRGLSQTDLPWPDFLEPGHAGRDEWFHDLVDADGTPHDPEELDVLARELRRAGW